MIQPKHLPRLTVGLLILAGIAVSLFSSWAGVNASPPRQDATPTPVADCLAQMIDSRACQEMFSTYYHWLDQGGKVRFYFVTNEDGEPNDDPSGGNVASYATGDLGYSVTDKTQLTGTGLQYFNDRRLFDPNSADKIQLTVSPTGVQ